MSRLSPGLIDGGKNIFQPGLLGIKPHRKEVLLGVIDYCLDAPEGADRGAHGVRAAASDKPTLLHHARHPKIYVMNTHGGSLVLPVLSGFRLHSQRPGLFS